MPDPDLLAAVVLHTLVSRAGGGVTAGRSDSTSRGHSGDARPTQGSDPSMTLADIAIACERDPANANDRREVERALEILRADELASHDGDRWRPTRAAIRAAELSF